MTKKTLTVYSMLFLFAFTFGLSFTLASTARAELPCCVVEWCPGEPSPGPSIEGHLVPKKWEPGYDCIYDGSDDCDMYHIC